MFEERRFKKTYSRETVDALVFQKRQTEISSRWRSAGGTTTYTVKADKK